MVRMRAAIARKGCISCPKSARSDAKVFINVEGDGLHRSSKIVLYRISGSRCSSVGIYEYGEVFRADDTSQRFNLEIFALSD